LSACGLNAIKGFAGDDMKKAKYYLEDKESLFLFQSDADHYEVVGQSTLSGNL